MVVILISKCKMYIYPIATHAREPFSESNIPCWNGIKAQISNIWSIDLVGLNNVLIEKSLHTLFQHTINRTETPP